MPARSIEARHRNRPGHDARHPRSEGAALQARRPVQRKAALSAFPAAAMPAFGPGPAKPGEPRPFSHGPVQAHRLSALPALRRRQAPVQPPPATLRHGSAGALRRPGSRIILDSEGTAAVPWPVRGTGGTRTAAARPFPPPRRGKGPGGGGSEWKWGFILLDWYETDRWETRGVREPSHALSPVQAVFRTRLALNSGVPLELSESATYLKSDATGAPNGSS